MEKNRKSEEIVWKREGFVEKNEEIHMDKVKNFTEKGKQFIWKRICMAKIW